MHKKSDIYREQSKLRTNSLPDLLLRLLCCLWSTLELEWSHPKQTNIYLVVAVGGQSNNSATE